MLQRRQKIRSGQALLLELLLRAYASMGRQSRRSATLLTETRARATNYNWTATKSRAGSWSHHGGGIIVIPTAHARIVIGGIEVVRLAPLRAGFNPAVAVLAAIASLNDTTLMHHMESATFVRLTSEVNALMRTDMNIATVLRQVNGAITGST